MLSTCVGDVGVERRHRDRVLAHRPSSCVDGHDRHLLLPGLGEEHRHRVADVQLVVVGGRPSAPQHRAVPSSCKLPCTACTSTARSDRPCGSNAVPALRLTVRPSRVERSDGHAPVSGSASIFLRRRSGSARPCRTASRRSSRCHRLVDRCGDRRLRRRREHGDERHQPDTDHQRRRRCRGATRVARRVLPGQRARHAAERGSGEPTTRGERPGDDRTEHRDADEHGERTQADRTDTGTGQALAMNAAPSSVTTVPITARRFDVPCVSRATSRIASIGATFAALRAGRYAATNVTTTPTTIDTMIVRGFTTVPAAGSSMPNASSTKRRPCAVPMPATTPIADANTPVKQRLEHHRTHHLLALGADRPQQRGLLGALRNGDRERVVDHERTDDERHERERHQERCSRTATASRGACVLRRSPSRP